MSGRPLVIDTDPGVDDAVAILLALASPELDVLSVNAVAGNVPLADTARNARKVLEVAGRTDIPVHAGCSRPLLREPVFGKYAREGGLAGDTLPEPSMPLSPVHAVDALSAILAEAAAGRRPKVTVCALGPLTNLAVAIARSPAIVAGIERLAVMGGAFAEMGNRVPWAEFNFLADPHAARIVLDCGAPIDLIPLDLTFTALATPEWLAEIRDLGRVGAVAHRLLTYFDRGDPKRYGRPGGPVHDPIVVASVLWPELFEGRPARVTVETAHPRIMGHAVVDWAPPAANVTVLNRIDAGAFFHRLSGRLARYPLV